MGQLRFGQHPVTAAARPMTRLGVVIDLSNAIHSAQRLGTVREPVLIAQRVRIHLPCFFRRVVQQARLNLARGLLCTSISDTNRAALQRVRDEASIWGLETRLLSRNPFDNKEEGVDEALLTACHRMIDNGVETQIVVSGDHCFAEPVRRALVRGVKVEVVAFLDSLAPALLRWYQANTKLVLLDDFYEKITFVEGGRRCQCNSR